MVVTITKVKNGYVVEPGYQNKFEPRLLTDMYVANSASDCWKIAWDLLEGKIEVKS